MSAVNVSFNLDINSGTQAVVDDYQFEIGKVLQDIQRTLESGYDQGMVRDTNGNRIGTWKLDIETEDE